MRLGRQRPDPWFAALASIGAVQGGPVSTDPELAARLAPGDPGSWTPPDVRTEHAVVPGGPRVRLYRPQQEPQGWFVWVHGGAWAFGDLDMPEADATAREVCARARVTVVSVDYRLATGGVHYPVPLDDVEAAIDWSIAQAGGQVPAGGASAGANLVTGATLRLRDAGASTPSKLLLMYPCVHARLPEPDAELATKIGTLSPLIRFEPERVYGPLARNYLGGTEDSATPYAMPALADVTGLPPTLVHNCEYDALRASGEAFADQLRAAGVEVEQSCAEGALHGHLSHPWLPQSQAAYERMVAFLSSGS